jgi:hypothetical protein
MATCSTYCATPFPEHTVNDCNTTIGGGVKNMVLFGCQSEAAANDDYTTATINADIAAGYATLIKEIKSGSAALSPNAVGAVYVAGNVAGTKNYNVDITLMDQNVSSVNDVAYQALNATTGTEIAAILSDTVDAGTDCVVYKPISSFTLVGGLVVPDDDSDVLHYEFTISGKTKYGAELVARPSNVFE